MTRNPAFPSAATMIAAAMQYFEELGSVSVTAFFAPGIAALIESWQGVAAQ